MPPRKRERKDVSSRQPRACPPTGRLHSVPHRRGSAQPPKRQRPPGGGRLGTGPAVAASAGGRPVLRPGLRRQVFLDPRLLALEAAQVVELARADLAAALDL